MELKKVSNTQDHVSHTNKKLEHPLFFPVLLSKYVICAVILLYNITIPFIV